MKITNYFLFIVTLLLLSTSNIYVNAEEIDDDTEIFEEFNDTSHVEYEDDNVQDETPRRQVETRENIRRAPVVEYDDDDDAPTNTVTQSPRQVEVEENARSTIEYEDNRQDEVEVEENIRLPKGEEETPNRNAIQQNTERYNESSMLFDELLSTSESEATEEDKVKGSDDKIKGDEKPSDQAITEPTHKLIECNNAEIVVLNKVTAQSSVLTLKKGGSEYSGNIEVKLYRSVKQEDPYAPDNLVLLKVIERKLDDDPKVIFQGWLYSSSTSLSSLQHPVYEIIARRSF